ncbi:unnamed protein product, partial [marine sediment metagenome]
PLSEDFKVDPIACEGCAVCSWNCPENAIVMKDNVAGEYFISDIPNGVMVHALLNPGEDNSGKLVSQVKKTAKEAAEKKGIENILIDGAPGIGCPVIASLSGVNLALIVTEPSRSGIHDLERVLSLCGHFKISAKVIINKYDINPRKSEEIEDYCKKTEIPILDKIPFSKEVYEAVRTGKTVIEYNPQCEASEIIQRIGKKIWKF